MVSVKDYGGKLTIQKCSVEDPKIEREEIIEWGVTKLKGKSLEVTLCSKHIQPERDLLSQH